ncbi:hypothetical protein Tco_0635576 [Tanacetum coccineum]
MEIAFKDSYPLALVVAVQQYPDPYYQAQKSHKSYAPPSNQSSSTRSNTTTKLKGKEIAKPITPLFESAFEEDSDPEQAQRDKDITSSNSINKNVDTTLRYKNDNQTGQFRNQRTVSVAGDRETVGSLVVQQTGILCFNRKEFDWLEDMDEEIDKHKLEAHYSYMAKIQEVPTADSETNTEPLEQACSFMLCDLDFEPLSLSLSSMPSCDLVSLTNILILCLILKASNQS